MIVANEDAALPVRHLSSHDDAILFCNRRSAGISELRVSPLFRLATPTLPGGSVELPMARDIIRAAHDGSTSDARDAEPVVNVLNRRTISVHRYMLMIDGVVVGVIDAKTVVIGAYLEKSVA